MAEHHLPYLWMLLGAAAFAVMAVLTSALREVFAWQWIAAARSGLAMLFAAILVIAGGGTFLILRPVTLWWRSVAGSISLLCGFYAMTHYDVSVVLTLTNMYPLWVAVLSWPLLGIVPSGDTWLAALVGVIGVAVLASDQPSAASHVADASPMGALHLATGSGAVTAKTTFSTLPIGVAAISAFTSALALLGLHRLRGLDHRAVVVHFSATAFLFCLGAAWLLPQEPLQTHVTRNWISWGLLLAVGLSATIGQLLLTKAFAYGDPGRVSVVGLSQICFAMVIEALWHDRVYSGQTLLGMALVLLPTAWVMWRGSTQGTPPSEVVQRTSLPERQVTPAWGSTASTPGSGAELASAAAPSGYREPEAPTPASGPSGGLFTP